MTLGSALCTMKHHFLGEPMDFCCHGDLKYLLLIACASSPTGCSESILDILTDVCQEYYLRMTHSLRHAVDAEALHGTTGFQVMRLAGAAVVHHL